MSLVGQNAKYSPRVDFVRFASNSDIARRRRHFAFVPTCDIERAGRPKEKAARRRLSILIVVDQAATMMALTSDDGPLRDNDF
jgi:hypothetical protein